MFALRHFVLQLASSIQDFGSLCVDCPKEDAIKQKKISIVPLGVVAIMHQPKLISDLSYKYLFSRS